MWPFASSEDVQAKFDQLRDQLRSDFDSRIQTVEQNLVREIQQIKVPQEVLRLQPEFTEKIKQVVISEMRRFDTPSGLNKIPDRFERLQKQVETLADLISQVSPIQPTGEKKPIHPLIDARIKAARAMIDEVGNDHSEWLEEQVTLLQSLKPAIDDLQKQYLASIDHIRPSEDQ